MVAVVAAVVGGWFTLRYATARQATQTPDDADAAAAVAATTEKVRVTLSAAKQQAAQIRTQPVAMQEVPDCRTVPGRLQYDDRRHVKVQVATTGVVVEVHVKPGDQVTAGQTLAVISSPEVGEARADVLKRQAEWEIAQRKHQWESQVETNLPPFVAAIQQRLDVNQLQKQFRTTTLGEYREKLVSAYTRLVLAESMFKGADSVSASGLLTARTVQERTAERQAAEAALLAACEQAAFDAEQRRDLAAMNAKDTQRRSEIAKQHLRTLLGYEPTDDPEKTKGAPDLSLVELRAPFAGTIERRNFSNSERVQPNDELFVLADTTVLWMVADVREQDWLAIGVKPGASISVRVPAIPDRTFTAAVHFVGREVSAASNAVSIVAEMDNRDAMLRPGQFVQATLTVGSPAPVLAVPSTALVTHEHQSFVFVQEDAGTYRRVDVDIGRQSDDWIEIRSGLKVGESVVVNGAFLLKSELLLEPEE